MPRVSRDHGARRPGLWGRASRAERGVALLVVLATLTLLTAVVEDFQFNSRVDLELAYNARDGLQAEYNALSALRMRALLLKHSQLVSGAINGLLGPLGGDASMIPPVGQLLEMIPIDCGLLSAIAREADADVEEGAEGEEFFTGECSATSKSEGSKISLLALGNPGEAKKLVPLFIALLSNKALEKHFQEDDRNGSHAESPEELIGAISDWVDRDRNQTGNQVSDEDRLYANLRDDYRAKNAPFDSLAELQLVYGIDDELYDLLKDVVTIYTNTITIDLTTANDQQMLLGMLMSVRDGANGFELLSHPGMAALWQLLQEMRASSMLGFVPLNVQLLTGLIQQAGLEAIIDTQRLNQVFGGGKSGTGSSSKQVSNWYTIEAEGRVGNATRRIRAVFQANPAQWLWVRIE